MRCHQLVFVLVLASLFLDTSSFDTYDLLHSKSEARRSERVTALNTATNDGLQWARIASTSAGDNGCHADGRADSFKINTNKAGLPVALICQRRCASLADVRFVSVHTNGFCDCLKVCDLQKPAAQFQHHANVYELHLQTEEGELASGPGFQDDPVDARGGGTMIDSPQPPAPDPLSPSLRAHRPLQNEAGKEFLSTLPNSGQGRWPAGLPRVEGWVHILSNLGVRRGAELGVYRGKMSEFVLAGAPLVEDYIMVDPWSHLEDWNKPINHNDAKFEEVYQIAVDRVKQFGERARVLRAKTKDAAAQVEDGSLDWIYIDDDHTLRGTLVTLISWYPKVRSGGWICGDDFFGDILRPDKDRQHGTSSEPTMVKPAVMAWAEAVGAELVPLGLRQFIFQKP